MLRDASATAIEAETDQAASQTEARAVETRTGPGRETDTTTAIETETANVAETVTGCTHRSTAFAPTFVVESSPT
jgi:hypothetical protein